MNYRCPKCQSSQIFPVASQSSSRPIIPKSLVILILSILALILLVIISLIVLALGNDASPILQGATILAFLSSVVSGIFFWRVFADFKINMQSFLQSQKHWKCRQCNHEWQN